MEQKLLLIGLAMGAYAFLTKYFNKKGILNSPVKRALWHAVFCASAGAIIMTMASVSIFDRTEDSPVTFGYVFLWVLAIFGAGGWGFVKTKNSSPEAMSPVAREDLEWADTIFAAVILASFVMYFFMQAFKIPSASMRSTFLEGDHLFVKKFNYGFKIPFTHKKVAKLSDIKQKDVVIFRFPTDDPKEPHCGGLQYNKDFVKRVIGLPGDTVEIKDGVPYVNGKLVQDEFYAQYTDGQRIGARPSENSPEDYQRLWETRELGGKYGELLRDNFGPVKVPPGNYFVMGDNRDHSCDSRFWGPVPEYEIKGSAWFIYWPPARMKGVR